MKEILSLQNNGKERKSWSIICENFPIYAPKKKSSLGNFVQVQNFIRRFHYRCKNFPSVKRLVEILFKHQL